MATHICKCKRADADLHRFREGIYSFTDSGTIGAHFPDGKMAIRYRGDFSFMGYNEDGLIIENCGHAVWIVRG